MAWGHPWELCSGAGPALGAGMGSGSAAGSRAGGMVVGLLLEQMWPLTVQGSLHHTAFRAISKWLLNTLSETHSSSRPN